MGVLLGAEAGKMSWISLVVWASLFYGLTLFADRFREKRRTSL